MASSAFQVFWRCFGEKGIIWIKVVTQGPEIVKRWRGSHRTGLLTPFNLLSLNRRAYSPSAVQAASLDQTSSY